MTRQSDWAISVFGAIESQQRVYGNRICGADPRDYAICVAAARVQKDETLFNQLWEEGSNLALETAIAYALSNSDE